MYISFFEALIPNIWQIRLESSISSEYVIRELGEGGNEGIFISYIFISGVFRFIFWLSSVGCYGSALTNSS